MSRWVWTDEPSEGWCGDFATREDAIEDGRLATAESFEVGEVEAITEEGVPMTFLRREEVSPLAGTGNPQETQEK